MHAGGRETSLAISADTTRAEGVTIPIHVVIHPGDMFFFSDGAVSRR
jgi:hypothetical protein